MTHLYVLKVGDIWRENDPRLNPQRFVKVIAIDPKFATIIRVFEDGDVFPNPRETRTMIERFRGQRGGYSFVRRAGDTA